MAKLTVVDEKTPPSKPLTLEDAVDHGTRRDELVALRALVARHLANPRTPAPAMAALSRQLIAMSKELQALDAAGSDDDRIGAAAAVPDETWDARR